MKLHTLLAVALATVTACVGSPPPDGGNTPTTPGSTGNPGGTDPTNPGGGGSAMTVAQYFDGLGHKECDQAFACQSTFPAANGKFSDAFGASATACYADAASYYDAATVAAEISAGKIMFNGTAAAACIAGITQTADCAGYWANGAAYPAACATAIVGTVADGGACVVDFDCANAASICDPTGNKCGPNTQARTSPLGRFTALATLLAR